MRSVIFGTLFTVFLASAGTVQAANELDGKTLLCVSPDKYHPIYGYLFDQGRVTKWWLRGLSKSKAFSRHPYSLKGTKFVYWRDDTHDEERHRVYLNRKTLKVGNDQCSISTKTEIFRKLDEIIAAAKKKNKI